MTRETSGFYAIIYGLPNGITNDIHGGSVKFANKAELNKWISTEKVVAHPKYPDHGILPDGRAVQIFHGHTESLVTKVEIG